MHDGFQMLSGLSDAPTQTTRCRCQAATEHRFNSAHLVLHSIWNDELKKDTQSTIGEDAKTNPGRTPTVNLVAEKDDNLTN